VKFAPSKSRKEHNLRVFKKKGRGIFGSQTNRQLTGQIYIQKDKAVPLQASSGPEGSRKLRLPDFMTTAQDGGKVVSVRDRPPLPPRKCSWYSFLLEAELTPGP